MEYLLSVKVELFYDFFLALTMIVITVIVVALL
jgi:hypothetical protein